ncbi:hypothetical protein DSM104443_01068 [Usitatibacter rugosus]|uniref:Uncharacterized protein n=1 Tax=Usitatibacter rugosus TaxID=2732067 RepID=A0A6M4GWN3_9PROT|nr:hypothetical protein [Usitatibacter rugosus]QJR10017.1 hypothetical protein DSM104443_01068 [Usitatibacter rugosus]
MRIALIALCASSGLACAQAFVDLDRPGVLENLARDNPARYQKITAILDAAAVQPCETLPKLLNTDYDVTDTRCSPYLLMASFPPKRQIGFRLDDVSYTSNVVLVHFPQPKAHPAVPVHPVQPLAK